MKTPELSFSGLKHLKHLFLVVFEVLLWVLLANAFFQLDLNIH